MYSIDQGGQPINASAVSFQGSNLKITISAIGGGYEGRLSADGNTITGTWTQGAATPLNLTRATPATAWAIPEPTPAPKPMAADANLDFEVATIKPSNPAAQGQSILVGRGGANMFTTTNTTLNDLLIFAYGIHIQQLTGGPGWLETEKFDITAKPEQPGIPDATQLRTMVQKLIAERFKLTFHGEKKELAAYTVTVRKNRPKLSKNETGGNLPGFGGRGGTIGVRNSTMAEFELPAGQDPRSSGRGSDKLERQWDFTLEWRPDPTQERQTAHSFPRKSPRGRISSRHSRSRLGSSSRLQKPRWKSLLSTA